jgi:hypothetical protein
MTYASIVKSLSKMTDQLVAFEDSQRFNITKNDARVQELESQSKVLADDAHRAHTTAEKLREILQ